MASRRFVFPFSVILAISLLGVPGAAQQASSAINSQRRMTSSRAVPRAVAAPGDLDPAFGGDGTVTTNFDGTVDWSDGARAVAVDSEGRVVVVGETNNAATPPDFALARYLADGTLDTSFGVGGKVITDFGSQDMAKDITLDGMGRIIVVGMTANYFTGRSADLVVGRYLPDGSLDPSFGVGGKVTTDIGGLGRQDWASAVTVDWNRRILVAGCHDCQPGHPRKYVLACYRDDGTLDPSFGTGGFVSTDFGYAALPGEATAVMQDAQGRIVVGGRILARFLPNGKPDPTFGTGGWATVDFPPGRRGQIYAATLDTADRILVAGRIDNPVVGSGDDFALARYSSNGTLDPAFGVDGWVAADFLEGYGHNDSALAIVSDPTGQIVVAGFSTGGPGADFAVARYLGNGIPDPGFGSGGKVTTDFGGGSGSYDFALDVTLDGMGRILVAGETDTQPWAAGRDFAVARYLGGERLTGDRGAWQYTGNLDEARNYQTATRLADGRVMVAGGWGRNISTLASAEVYDPVTGQWAPAGSMSIVRCGHAAALLADGRVLVMGGGTEGSWHVASAEVYDPASGQWRSTGNLHTGRAWHAAVRLRDGRVLVAGGMGENGYLDSAELYDPASEQWTATGSMTTGRRDLTLTVLADGDVLAVVGYGFGALSSAEIYDPDTGEWTVVGSLGTSRHDHTATLLPDGRVLVVGGYTERGGLVLASAELYDPISRQWSPTGSLVYARWGHSAAPLPGGRVLVAGGAAVPGGIKSWASAEVYDAATGLWSQTGSLNAPRGSHTATTLLDYRVLVAGGFAKEHLRSAELYDWARCCIYLPWAARNAGAP